MSQIPVNGQLEIHQRRQSGLLQAYETCFAQASGETRPEAIAIAFDEADRLQRQLIVAGQLLRRLQRQADDDAWGPV